MTRPALSQRDRRALAFGASALAVALVFVYGVRPIQRQITERRASAGAERELLARERAVIAVAPHVPVLIAERVRVLDEENARIIVSDAPATASVRFADRVREVARAHELLVTQTTELPADSLPGGVRVLRLSVRGESDLTGILGFLRAIETGTMHVRIASLQVEQARGVRVAGAAAQQPAFETLALTATFEVPSVIVRAQQRNAP